MKAEFKQNKDGTVTITKNGKSVTIDEMDLMQMWKIIDQKFN